MSKIIERRHGDKVFAISYEPGYEELAEKKLDAEIARYKRQEKLVQLGTDQVATELRREAETRCNNCGALQLVQKRDRTEYRFTIFGYYSEVWPYMQCQRCGSQQELRQLPAEVYEAKAQRLVDNATRRITESEKVRKQGGTAAKEPQ